MTSMPEIRIMNVSTRFKCAVRLNHLSPVLKEMIVNLLSTIVTEK
jgi:hypothetical protein